MGRKLLFQAVKKKIVQLGTVNRKLNFSLSSDELFELSPVSNHIM